jgi:uncharacterized repeat protein (TIGR01451 family)
MNRLKLILAAAGLVSVALIAQAAPPAGTQIGNQATATYSDSSSITRTVTSNATITIVQQVASASLAAGIAKTANPSGQVSFPQTLTNNGNGTDTFNLTQSNTGSFSFSSVQYYTDANGDGIPDNTTAITNTGEIAAGGTFKFVAVGIVPSTATSGNTNTLTVTATSTFDGTVTATATDTSTITSNAVINVTQAIDVSNGPSPAGPRTLTITYTNVGNTAASNLTLADVIPSGMTYVAGSARWSVTGSGTVLTDASNADSQSGIIYDFGVTQATRATAVIAAVAPGASGSLTFQVNVNSSQASGATAATALTATFGYNDGSSTVSTANTNTVQYTVQSSASISVSSATVASATQGSTVSWANTITNAGNGSDNINLTFGTSTFPAGTTFQLFRSDGVTPILDSNGDGISDTGPIAGSSGTASVVVKAILPPGATGGPYTVQLNARSTVDSTKTGSGTDTLTAITGNTVDITYLTAGGSGSGAGPEASAVATNTTNPGTLSSFTIVVTNTGTTADNYNLGASTDGSFNTTVIPSGWTVVFKDTNGAVVPNTGTIAGQGSATFTVDVTPAAGASGSTDIYVRALSPASGSSDRMHLAVNVTAVRGLAIAPSNSGQLAAGGTIIYTHTISNPSNVLEGDGAASTVTLSSSNSNTAFTSVIYWDQNNNGTLDAADPVLTNLAQLTGGTNGASTAAGLSVGETARIFVKVTAPPGAANATANTTTLTATTTGTINGVAAPGPVNVADNTTVIVTQVSLVKTQALDANCDGTADTAYSTATITSGAIPNACIRYRILATNSGGASISNLVVSDATPINTVYSSTSPASSTTGTVTAPANGSAGTVQATVGTLAPGQSATLEFGVKILP